MSIYDFGNMENEVSTTETPVTVTPVNETEKSSKKSVAAAVAFGGLSLVVSGFAIWKFRELKKELQNLSEKVNGTDETSEDESDESVTVENLDERLSDIEESLEDYDTFATEVLDQRINILLMELKITGASVSDINRYRRMVTSITDFDKAVEYLQHELDVLEKEQLKKEGLSEEDIAYFDDKNKSEDDEIEDEEEEDEEDIFLEETEDDDEDEDDESTIQEETVTNSKPERKPIEEPASNSSAKSVKIKKGVEKSDDNNTDRTDSGDNSKPHIQKSVATDAGENTKENHSDDTVKKSQAKKMIVEPVAPKELNADDIIEAFGDSIDVEIGAQIIHLSEHLNKRDWTKVASKLNRLVGYKNVWNTDQLVCKVIDTCNNGFNLPSYSEEKNPNA